MDSKGTDFSTMFIYIAMIIMGVSIVVSLTNYFSVFNIFRALCGAVVIGGYYLLSQKKKIGFIVMWLGTLLYAIILSLLAPEGAIVSVFMSSEMILNIFVTFAIVSRLKTMS